VGSGHEWKRTALTFGRYLALICLMGDDSPSEKKAVIDYNVGVFQAALKQVFPRSEREIVVQSPS
jgi:Ras-related GTP-binding protein C/D